MSSKLSEVVTLYNFIHTLGDIDEIVVGPRTFGEVWMRMKELGRGTFPLGENVIMFDGVRISLRHDRGLSDPLDDSQFEN